MRNLFRRARSDSADDSAPNISSIGDDRRVYAIGDVHGRHDLLTELLAMIDADDATRGPVADRHLILLGDLIDRGPDSAEVVRLVLSLRDTWPAMECLMGNHEEIFVQALEGDFKSVKLFRQIGRETLLSYGIPAQVIDEGDNERLYRAMKRVPKDHHEFLAALPARVVLGDYCFVHAGIRPGIPLEIQDERDMRWIRREFLGSRVKHSHVIVHGHSISEYADNCPHRIGIDTGAYRSDRLTAVGLQGTERWFLST